MYPSPLKDMQIYISVNFPVIGSGCLEYVQLTLTVQHLWVSSAHWQASAAPLFRVLLPFPSVSLKYKIWRSCAPHRSQQDQDAPRTRWRCRSNSNRRTGNVFFGSLHPHIHLKFVWKWVSRISPPRWQCDPACKDGRDSLQVWPNSGEEKVLVSPKKQVIMT